MELKPKIQPHKTCLTLPTKMPPQITNQTHSDTFQDDDSSTDKASYQPTHFIQCDMLASNSVRNRALGSFLDAQDDDSTTASKQTETPSSQGQGSEPPDTDGQAGSLGAGKSEG